jgi:hypothetical protein
MPETESGSMRCNKEDDENYRSNAYRKIRGHGYSRERPRVRFARDPGGICAKRPHLYRLGKIENRLPNASCCENLFQLFVPVN